MHSPEAWGACKAGAGAYLAGEMRTVNQQKHIAERRTQQRKRKASLVTMNRKRRGCQAGLKAPKCLLPICRPRLLAKRIVCMKCPKRLASTEGEKCFQDTWVRVLWRITASGNDTGRGEAILLQTIRKTWSCLKQGCCGQLPLLNLMAVGADSGFRYALSSPGYPL